LRENQLKYSAHSDWKCKQFGKHGSIESGDCVAIAAIKLVIKRESTGVQKVLFRFVKQAVSIAGTLADAALI
jgi:hypothetical protein